MPKDTTNKKTLWGRFKSWLAGTWPGRAWSKVLNTVKGWFSSNGATKANAANSPASEVPSNDREVPAPGLDNGQGPRASEGEVTDQAKDDTSKQPKDDDKEVKGVVNYHTPLQASIFKRKVSGEKAVFMLEIEEVHRITSQEKQQTIDLINEVNGEAIFAKVGKAEFKMICRVSGSDIVIDKVLDSNGNSIGIKEIQEYGISRISATPTIPALWNAIPASTVQNDTKLKSQSSNHTVPTPQQGFKALITIDGENLQFVSMKGDTTDYIRECKNPANGNECLVYVKHGEDMYRIIFTGDGKINSIAKQHKSTQHMNDNAINPNNNMESAKTLFGLNETTPMVKITEISNVPFKAPEAAPTPPATNGEKSSSSTNSTTSKKDVAVVPYQAWDGRTLYFDPKLSAFLESRKNMEIEKLLMRTGDPSSKTDGPKSEHVPTNGKSGPSNKV